MPGRSSSTSPRHTPDATFRTCRYRCSASSPPWRSQPATWTQRDAQLHRRPNSVACCCPGRVCSLSVGDNGLAVALAVDGDEVATDRFTALVDEVPLTPWPAWPYISALCAMRALLPDTEWLDDIGFGPAIHTAVDAGRAIAMLRAVRPRHQPGDRPAMGIGRSTAGPGSTFDAVRTGPRRDRPPGRCRMSRSHPRNQRRRI